MSTRSYSELLAELLGLFVSAAELSRPDLRALVARRQVATAVSGIGPKWDRP